MLTFFFGGNATYPSLSTLDLVITFLPAVMLVASSPPVCKVDIDFFSLSSLFLIKNLPKGQNLKYCKIWVTVKSQLTKTINCDSTAINCQAPPPPTSTVGSGAGEIDRWQWFVISGTLARTALFHSRKYLAIPVNWHHRGINLSKVKFITYFIL